jgi:hypothetical protein
MRGYEEGRHADVDAAWTRLTKLTCITPTITPQKKINFFGRLRTIAAVCFSFISLISLFYLLFHHSAKQTDIPVAAPFQPGDATPNSNHAFLTRYNGDTVALDGFNGSLLGREGRINVKKNYTGELSYYEAGYKTASELLYNKVTVPKGGNAVQLQLSDGSNVWLNAASTIVYPVTFNEDERKVEITGEAYFEVAHSNGEKLIPFIVNKGNMTITVLGTKFNVNAYYNEEDTKVTLLEGSLKVSNEHRELIVKAGQQAVLNKERISLANAVDVEQVMAWKDGKFVFNNTNIQPIMRQMERWYDLAPTQYENETAKQWEFNGEISRYSNASKVLQLLEKTGSVHFQLEGKRIIVSQ